MHSLSVAHFVAGCLIGPAVLATITSAQDFQRISFRLDSGMSVEAQQGEVQVAENRSNPHSRSIPIRFLKFETRAQHAAHPIIYLAGGPGGSGTAAAHGRRWEMFDRLLDVADVIILDQRGTGLSDSIPPCHCQVEIPGDQATTRDLWVRLHRQAMQECLDFWQRQEVDIRGYTTWESAADVEAVRLALGVQRVNLLGISYGTHLAMATLKRYPNRVDRLVLASAEGLDQTVKRPALTDVYFQRLQAAINMDADAAQKYPDVQGLIKEVLDRVDADPPQLNVWKRDGSTYQRTLGRFELQLITGGLIADPSRVRSLLKAYTVARQGNFDYFLWFLQPTVSVRGMSEAMDIASGISADRLRLIQAESKTALLGDALNFPVPHLADAIPGIDLGDDFRAPLQSDRPALFLSGTLDGRTYPESHAEIASGFPQGVTITIQNAGHNLFFSHPRVVDLVVEFLSGASTEGRTLTASPPAFE